MKQPDSSTPSLSELRKMYGLPEKDIEVLDDADSPALTLGEAQAIVDRDMPGYSLIRVDGTVHSAVAWYDTSIGERNIIISGGKVVGAQG